MWTAEKVVNKYAWSIVCHTHTHTDTSVHSLAAYANEWAHCWSTCQWNLIIWIDWNRLRNNACLIFVCVCGTVTAVWARIVNRARLCSSLLVSWLQTVFSCFFMQRRGNLSGGNWRDLALKASRCELWIYPTIHLLSATFSFHLQPVYIQLAYFWCENTNGSIWRLVLLDQNQS